MHPLCPPRHATCTPRISFLPSLSIRFPSRIRHASVTSRSRSSPLLAWTLHEAPMPPSRTRDASVTPPISHLPTLGLFGSHEPVTHRHAPVTHPSPAHPSPSCLIPHPSRPCLFAFDPSSNMRPTCTNHPPRLLPALTCTVTRPSCHPSRTRHTPDLSRPSPPRRQKKLSRRHLPCTRMT